MLRNGLCRGTGRRRRSFARGSRVPLHNPMSAEGLGPGHGALVGCPVGVFPDPGCRRGPPRQLAPPRRARGRTGPGGRDAPAAEKIPHVDEARARPRQAGRPLMPERVGRHTLGDVGSGPPRPVRMPGQDVGDTGPGRMVAPWVREGRFVEVPGTEAGMGPDTHPLGRPAVTCAGDAAPALRPLPRGAATAGSPDLRSRGAAPQGSDTRAAPSHGTAGSAVSRRPPGVDIPGPLRMAASPSPPGAAVASGFPSPCLMARTCRCRGSRAGPSPLVHPASAPVARGRRSAVPSEFPRAAGHPGTPGRVSARIGRRRRPRILAMIVEAADGRPGCVAARGRRVGAGVAPAGRAASQTVGGVACEAGVGHGGTTHPHSRPTRATMPGRVPAAGRR